MDMPEKNSRKSVGQAEEGKWFCTVGYWLFPAKCASRPWEKLGELLDRPAPAAQTPVLDSLSSEKRKATRAEAEAASAELRRKCRAIHEAEVELYNAQPVWRLREIAVRSSEEALELLDEFVAMVCLTSSEYCWALRDPGKQFRWRDHGWKHVEYGSLERLWKNYSRGFEAAFTAEALGYDKTQKLFLAAVNGDPEAVGILWKLFPNGEEHQGIIDFFVGHDLKANAIPEPDFLAAELVAKIFSRSDSEESAHALSALNKLVSPSASRGERMRRGRPRILVAPTHLRLLRKMSYCLIRQVVEVSDFILHAKLEKDRHKLLFESYPWIRRISPDLKTFSSYGQSKASLELLSCVTGISASSLEKMRLRSNE